MLVTCAKCSSRYQIGDEKLKSTGTKVRCPRCQNTFRVFPQDVKESTAPSRVDAPDSDVFAAPPPPKDARFAPAPAPSTNPHADSDETEFFERKEVSSRKPPIKAMATEPGVSPRQPSSAKATKRELVTEDVFAPPQPPAKEASPFKRQMKATVDLDEMSEPPSVDDSFGESDSAPKSVEKVESTDPKPFGDATFFALQQMTKPKGSQRRILIAAMVIVVAALGFFVLTQGPSRKAPEAMKASAPEVPSQPKIAFDRPPNWYKDDPNVYQDFLTQTATRPLADQKRPEIRALVAEALILNGVLNGADDQTASGLGIASGLIAAYPNAVYGFYGLSTYAEWRDDSQTLTDLVQKWPMNQRAEPEFQLAQIIVDAHSKEPNQALINAKNFLTAMPENRRAQVIILSIYLDASDELRKTFGDSTALELQKNFQKLRASYSSNTQLPPLLKAIEKKLARRPIVISKSEPKEPAPKESPAEPVANENKSAPNSEMTATQRLNERSLQRLEERRKRLMAETAQGHSPSTPLVTRSSPAPAPEAPPATPSAPTQSESVAEAAPKQKAQDQKKLPKASNNLVAMNKQTKREKTEAENLFEQANELQKNKKLDEAVGLYQKTLRLNPDFADVYKNLGVIYMNRNDKERALRNFKIYLQLKPQSEDKQMVEGWISSLQ